MASDEGGETATMPVTNGDLHPPPAGSAALSTPAKRKRVSSSEERSAQVNAPSASAGQDKEELDQTLRYLLQILARDDEDIHLFKCSLVPPSPAKPRSKRAKLSDNSDKNASIEARVAAGRYTSLQEFLDDVERASTAVIAKQQSQVAHLGAKDAEDSISNSKNRIMALKKHLHSLLIQVSYNKPSGVKTEPSEEGEDSAVHRPNPGTGREDKRVLTLFGNPSNPKQLFSSLQQPIKVPLGPDKQREVEIQPPLPEDKLPNGITAIKAAPFNLTIDEKPVKTFGEVFAPRPTLPQLEPPRRGRSWARNPSAMWIDPFDAITDPKAVPGEKNNYCFASLPSVSWLQYGGVTSSPSYWNRKQKQQDDSGKDQQQEYSTNDDDPALLQGVYSSFAPSYDSSSSIVQADSKNLVWWAKRGARRFKTLLALHYGAGGQEDQEQPQLPDLDEASLEEAVNSFKPEEVTEEVSTKEAQPEADTESKDVDEILREVSELLETLNSYRQIRNFDAQASDTDAGSPSTPSSAERTVYETLKSSLAAIIANLPPYAVAKLNGDQLADLNLSQKILVENPVYNGTMEEDDYTVLQKRIAAATPANHAVTPSRPGAYQGSPAAYNQRMYPPNARGQQPPAAAGYQGYYGGRHPSTSTPYTPGTAPQSYTPRPQASPSQRPSHLPAAYSQPGGQYMQRPNGYSPYPGQQGAPPPQGSPQPYAQRPGQPGYQQNPQYGPGRSASPQKQPGYATPQPPRTPYMNPGTNNPPRYYPPQQQPPQQQQPTHYGNYPPTQAPSSSTPYSNSAAAATYNRSAAEQAARTAANQQRQSSGTPNSPASQSQPQQQPQQNADQSASQDRSASPANKQSSTPVST
ncbi:hypothetical protein VTN77DRAFT_602 [Rasamsonia byssochlamydoides]|uniref:uncharacterized protein n=1 Tax=Rasamsonia byssochlamydoides TaxID=89139 RepID=UPI0037438E56